jgi:hypothetical protein
MHGNIPVKGVACMEKPDILIFMSDQHNAML